MTKHSSKNETHTNLSRLKRFVGKSSIRVNTYFYRLYRIASKKIKAKYAGEYQQGVSFCIVTNGKKFQKTLLEINSIRKTMRKSSVPYEIIICGDVKIFETVEGIQLVDTPADAHQGLIAKLRNNAAEKTQYEIIVFADDDLLFEPDWGKRLSEFSAQQDWDILGNRLLLPNGGRYWDRCTYDPHMLIDYDTTHYQGTLYQSGGFWLIKKRVYEQEKWDPELKFYAEQSGGINEDVEYSIRLQRKGYVLSFDKKNLVWHNDESYVEDVQGQRVLNLEAARIDNLTIPPLTEKFLNLQSSLRQSEQE